MKKLKRVFINTAVILLTQVFNISRAFCDWGSTACAISCSSRFISYDEGSETPEQIMVQLETKWNERENCHIDGISLVLESGIPFPDFNVKANWFTARAKVNELKFYTSSKMEPNAFNSSAFTSLTKLIFPSMSVTPISEGIFNGLHSLEELVMESAFLKVIESGVLDAVSETLKRFTLKTSSTLYSPILIDGFTGSSEPMIALEYVKFYYNLKSTLTRNSFVGLQNVITLDLSECKIETIGAGAFDPISSSIRELNLQYNEIKTLPDGLFNLMLTNDVTRILLSSNKWVCDCDLMPFKTILMEHSNFVGPFTCQNPFELRGYDILKQNFCDTYVPPPTTQSTSTTTTSTSTTTTTTTTAPTTPTVTDPPTEPPIPKDFDQICYDAVETELSKIVSIKTPTASLKINENEHGEVEVNIVGENSVLIWFSLADREAYYTASDELSCVLGATTRPVPISNLREDTPYTFCLMDSTENTVSPLDCVSYTKGNAREEPWLRNDNKGLIIGMVILAFCISVFIGLAVGFFTFHEIIKRRNPKLNACINEVLKETLHSNSKMRQQNRIFSMASSVNTERSTVDYYLEAPPLPARPHSMHPFEEPIYAVVRDTDTLK